MSNDQVESAYALMAACELCPRRCGVDRLQGEKGFCGVGELPVVASAGPHFGEEPPLIGYGGSGTIFMSGCNLGCVFCQNYDISHLRAGAETTVERIVAIMMRLAAGGCHNINFVSPSHVMAHLLDAIHRSREQDLAVPIVYNCGGYERLDALKLLDGSVEIYMPDAKYADGKLATEYSKAPDYPDVVKAALREMHRQVGDLEIVDGVATRGLLVRHLVMPNNVAGSREIIDFLADEISPNTYVNVMGQYRPTFRAEGDAKIGRYPTEEEFRSAYAYAESRALRLAR